MKVDPAEILAERRQRPSLFERYRFFVGGKVPSGHGDWALRNVGVWRWVAVNAALDLVWVMSTTAALGLLARGEAFPRETLAVIVVLSVLMSSLRVLYRRKRVVDSLRPPPAAAVLSQIGERRRTS